MRLEVKHNLINVSDTLDSNLLDGEAWVVLKRWVVGSFKFEVRNPHKPLDALGLVAIVDCHEDAHRDQKGSELNLGDVINSFQEDLSNLFAHEVVVEADMADELGYLLGFRRVLECKGVELLRLLVDHHYGT